MAEASEPKYVEGTSTNQVPLVSQEVVDDGLTLSKPIASPAGLTLLHTLEGQTNRITFVAWSPDGRLLAVAAADGKVRLWDAVSSTLLYVLESPPRVVSTGMVSTQEEGQITSVAWSPDGKLLAAGASHGSVLLWDSASNRLLPSIMLNFYTHKVSNYTYTVGRPVVRSVAWSPDGKLLTIAADDEVNLWNQARGTLHILPGRRLWNAFFIDAVIWSPDGALLAAHSREDLQLWDVTKGKQLQRLKVQVTSLAWSPDGKLLSAVGADGKMKLWDTTTGELLPVLSPDSAWAVASHIETPAWSPDGKLLASGGSDDLVHLWDPTTGRLLYTLEGHTNRVKSVAWSPDGTLLASGSSTDSLSPEAEIRIWRTDTWEPVAALTGLEGLPHVTWHPRLPVMVTAGQQKRDALVWHLDLTYLLQAAPSPETVHYANAKVMLVGDSGVGKSGLALVLTGQPFAPTDSTHGRRVWPLDRQEVRQENGIHETQEILLWDLAGQPDYRLIHQLHLHEATVALIVFDAARDTDPFAGIRYWHHALQQAQQARGTHTLPLKIFLVAARIDRGGRSVSHARMETLLQELGCAGYIETSAKDGRGIDELNQTIHTAIDWTKLPKVTSTRLLQAMKTFVFNEQDAGRLLRSTDDLYSNFLHTHDAPAPSEKLYQQFETVLGRMEALGAIRRLNFGNLILLQPERLDAYASALLIAVKDEPDGLGNIAEARVQQGDFFVPQEERLPHPTQETLLLIAMIDELVRHQLVLRESGFLLFPSQSTREHPERALLESKSVVTFTFMGPVLSIYTTLVVRLAQSGFFQKQDLWHHTITYTTRAGGLYGLLLSLQGEERAELGLFFDEAAREEMRFHFEDFVYRHLKRHVVGTLQRRRRYVCPTCGEAFTGTQVSKRQTLGFSSIRCSACDTQVSLLDGTDRLNTLPPSLVKAMEHEADTQRDRESAVSKLQGKIATQDFDVFLCHNGQDKSAVRKLSKQLKEHGLLPWLDEEQLQPGLPWQRLLEEQITQIKAAAVFVGKDGIGPWQHQELDAFLREFVSRGCPVIPVLLADAPQEPNLPVFLKAMTWVDFRVQDPDPMQRLRWGITGRRDAYKDLREDG
ncbi:MAG TPA: TIR domain-containing protein [Ktedonobacteraceae bacterium]|nr:TIR domain-containing protein [Ktedonobacteraceae bacterium]